MTKNMDVTKNMDIWKKKAMTKNMDIWKKSARPPKEALQRIGGGRLKGMTSISPQWRLKIMTEIFGPVGVDWSYEIQRVWSEPVEGSQVVPVFALVNVYHRQDGQWSEPIPGIGGSQLVAKEKEGVHVNDEAYKMAVTDALSTALKALGVAADIYLDTWDGSKYTVPSDAEREAPVSAKIVGNIRQLMADTETDENKLNEYIAETYGAETLDDLTASEADSVISMLQRKAAKR